MKTLPALFVGHGAPDLAIKDSPAHRFLKALGGEYPSPKAILAISAHWETSSPVVSAAKNLETIYDFKGFDPNLKNIVYSAPGAQKLAARIGALIPEVKQDSNRGLDHGAWVPLRLLYPDANIPVTQLSVMPHHNPQHHYDLGKKLRPLKEEGVLILATGGIVHNLGYLAPEGSPVPEWSIAFDQWVKGEIINSSDLEGLFNYKSHKYGMLAHPTPEHLMPLFVALGAGSHHEKRRQLHHSFSYGSVSMSAYEFY